MEALIQQILEHGGLILNFSDSFVEYSINQNYTIEVVETSEVWYKLKCGRKYIDTYRCGSEAVLSSFNHNTQYENRKSDSMGITGTDEKGKN